MPTSEARIAANRANALKSTGPKTPEGKGCSRRNGLKHGMSGRGVVVLDDDAAEVERREEALRAELAPGSAIAAILVRQLATLSVRMERGARQEFAAVAARVRHAADDFDEDRVERALELFEAIGDDPRGVVRRLRKSPEGVDRLILEWQDLRADLAREPRPYWTSAHVARAALLVELRDEEARGSRVGVLSRGLWGDFEPLADHEGGGLGPEGRKEWARAALLERIDAEVAGLRAQYEALDLEMIALDRAEAGERALFDPSREATLARRYESEARRGFFRALEEFRRVEAESDGREGSTPGPSGPEPGPTPVPLASSRDRPSPAPLEAPPGPSTDFSVGSEVARGADGRALTIGRPARGPA